MKVTKIYYERVFPIAPYVNEKLGLEIELSDLDSISPEGALSMAKQKLEDWHKTAHPELYIQTKSVAPLAEIPKPTPKEKSLIELIQESTDKEKLEKAFGALIKSLYKGKPEETVYNSQLQKLSA